MGLLERADQESAQIEAQRAALAEKDADLQARATELDRRAAALPRAGSSATEAEDQPTNGDQQDEVISLSDQQIIDHAVPAASSEQSERENRSPSDIETDEESRAEPSPRADAHDSLDPELAQAISSLRDHGVEGTDTELLTQAREELELRGKIIGRKEKKRRFRFWRR